MSPERYFIECKIDIVIGIHHSNPPNKQFWGQASRTIDGISVKVDRYAGGLSSLLTALELAWKDKTEILPKEFSTPPLLAAPVDADWKEITGQSDDISF